MDNGVNINPLLRNMYGEGKRHHGGPADALGTHDQGSEPDDQEPDRGAS